MAQTQDTQDTRYRADTQDDFNEVLQELRVILPGVQVLFAFLLIVPFNTRFTQLAGSHRWLYLTALLATAVSSAFLISPSAYLRLNRHHRQPERMLRTLTRLTISGITALGLAITTVVLLLVQFVFGTVAGAAAAAFVGGLIVGLWYWLPLSRRGS
jgi:uncharacterized membrane protein YidH (DUF202 family)